MRHAFAVPPHPYEDLIIVRGEAGGVGQLLLANMDGNEPRQIVRMSSRYQRPIAMNWSKRGDWVTYTAGPFFGKATAPSDVWRVRPDGSDVMNLTKDSQSNEGISDFSRDGKRMVFRSGRGGAFDIYLMNADGTNIRRLTDDPWKDNFPVFSPREDLVAFVSDRDGTPDAQGYRDFEIYTLDIGPSGAPGVLRRISGAPGQDSHPQFSPDGKWLIFTSDRGGINNEQSLIQSEQMDFTVGNLAASACAITLGAVLQASTGLGAGLIIVPLLGLISLELVPGPLIFASLALSFLMAYLGRNSINFLNVRTLMAGLIVGMALGTLSISAIPLDRAGILFGVLVLLAVAITAAGVRIQFTRLNLIAAGALSGFMGATAAIGAPVLALLYQHEESKTLRAILGFLYFVSSILMLAFLYAANHFGVKELRLGLYLIPGFLAGYVLATPVARVLDRAYSRTAVLLMSTVSAVVLVVKSVW